MTDSLSETPPAAPAPERDLDIVVFGATGFVGRLIAGHLSRHAPAQVRIGLAGRDLHRVDAVKAELADRAVYWKTLHADSSDAASLAQMAQRTKVVISTVGPYAQYGLPLVQACAEAGTDYVDLCGETLFVRDSIDAYDEIATAHGARIVHACGFDSIPSDLGVFATWRQVKKDVAGDLSTTTLYVTSLKGGLSGGTIASMVGQVDAAKEQPKLRGVLADPYALSPDRDNEPEPRRGAETSQTQADGASTTDAEPSQNTGAGQQPNSDAGLSPVQRVEGAAKLAFGALGKAAGKVAQSRSRLTPDAQIGEFTAPFIMGPFNSQVVRRSNALMSWSYGRDFRYRELVATGNSSAAPLRAAALSAAMPAAAAGFAFGPTRALLERVVTKPGEGPDEASRKEGRFTMTIHADTTSGAHYVTTVSAQVDPGYDGTAVMIGEAALALVLDELALPRRHGVLTPATAFGDVLIERLTAQGFSFEVTRQN
ncbi:saccharopine dehydrogenase family protein [Gephyromycinifex aptenodytis]|uniref:saccharopine dehydrogenase family protein n=1 Tax=Gephyromycinifex aptenodytis TaxID=2716227 RepID=UPI0014457027|nr:saccharopine dehydrogenase NADP-binding domain-containing protein [Gephyromycinifex aptenodytis]